MEKKINTSSDSSSSSEGTVTTIKSVVPARQKVSRQGSDSSSENSAAAIDSCASTIGDSIESLDSDPAAYLTPSPCGPAPAAASHSSTKGDSSTGTFWTGKELTQPEINITCPSSDESNGPSEPKKPRLLEKQDTLSDAESLPPDEPTVERTTPNTLTAPGLHPEDKALQGDPLPSPSSPRAVRPTELKVRSCLEDDLAPSRAQPEPTGATREVILTPIPPAGLPHSRMDIFKVPQPLNPQLSSERMPSIAGNDADEEMLVDVSPSDESAPQSSSSSSAPSLATIVTRGAAPTPAGESSTHTTQSQSAEEDAMDISEDDTASSPS